MEITKQPSTFADIVDRLHYKSEEELKRLYILFFKEELKEDWKNITKQGDFKNASEDDIIKAIQDKRYTNGDV